jgi:hypothetical protein
LGSAASGILAAEALGAVSGAAAEQVALNKLTHPRTNPGRRWTHFAESVHMNSHVGRIGRGPMTAEERLAELKAADTRRQTRRREALKQKGMTQQNVWLKPSVKAVIDQAIQNGRFRSRTEAIEWALASAFEEKSA